jgi:hypothetical protein
MSFRQQEKTLLVWNLRDGIDVYLVEDVLKPAGKLTINLQVIFPVRMAFMRSGNILVGSDNGESYIWDLKRKAIVRSLKHYPFVSRWTRFVGAVWRRRPYLANPRTAVQVVAVSSIPLHWSQSVDLSPKYVCRGDGVELAACASTELDQPSTLVLWTTAHVSIYHMCGFCTDGTARRMLGR